MHNQVSPAIIAITVMVAIGFTGFVLWRFADVHKPTDAISARAMLSNPKVQEAIMDRYRAKFGGANGSSPM